MFQPVTWVLRERSHLALLERHAAHHNPRTTGRDIRFLSQSDSASRCPAGRCISYWRRQFRVDGLATTQLLCGIAASRSKAVETVLVLSLFLAVDGRVA